MLTLELETLGMLAEIGADALGALAATGGAEPAELELELKLELELLEAELDRSDLDGPDGGTTGGARRGGIVQ